MSLQSGSSSGIETSMLMNFRTPNLCRLVCNLSGRFWSGLHRLMTGAARVAATIQKCALAQSSQHECMSTMQMGQLEVEDRKVDCNTLLPSVMAEQGRYQLIVHMKEGGVTVSIRFRLIAIKFSSASLI